jgi:hypothetical protein
VGKTNLKESLYQQSAREMSLVVKEGLTCKMVSERDSGEGPMSQTVLQVLSGCM